MQVTLSPGASSAGPVASHRRSENLPLSPDKSTCLPRQVPYEPPQTLGVNNTTSPHQSPRMTTPVSQAPFGGHTMPSPTAPAFFEFLLISETIARCSQNRHIASTSKNGSVSFHSIREDMAYPLFETAFSLEECGHQVSPRLQHDRVRGAHSLEEFKQSLPNQIPVVSSSARDYCDQAGETFGCPATCHIDVGQV